MAKQVFKLIAAMAVAGAAVMAACATSQPVGPSTRSTAPLVVENLNVSVGDTWVYRNFQVDTGNTNRTWTETVIAADGGGFTKRRTDRRSTSQRDETSTEVAIRFGEGLYSFPLYVGKSWQSANTSDPAGGSVNYRVVSSEVTDTVAGRFETLKIEASFTTNGQHYQQLIWFSPSIGNTVRLRYTSSQQATELTSYHLAD